MHGDSNLTIQVHRSKIGENGFCQNLVCDIKFSPPWRFQISSSHISESRLVNLVSLQTKMKHSSSNHVSFDATGQLRSERSEHDGNIQFPLIRRLCAVYWFQWNDLQWQVNWNWAGRTRAGSRVDKAWPGPYLICKPNNRQTEGKREGLVRFYLHE